MKKSILSNLLLVAITFVVLTFASCGVSDSQLKKIAAEANKDCPKQMDYLTTLDSIYASAGKELHYHYTCSLAKAEMDEMVSVEQFNSNIKSVILSLFASGGREAKMMKKTKAIFLHEYFDKDGNLYTIVKITPEDYL